MEQDIEITDAEMDAIARFIWKRGMDPTDPEFIAHINKCDCDECAGAKALMVLVGPRIAAMVEMGKHGQGHRN